MKRVNDLFSAWHGKKDGRISVFPAAGLAETSSPELLREVRAFAEKHDVGYTIHLAQTHAEVDYMRKYHGAQPAAFLSRNDFLGPRLFAAHCRYLDDSEIALLGRAHTIVSHQASMAGNRGVLPPIAKLRAEPRAGVTDADGMSQRDCSRSASRDTGFQSCSSTKLRKTLAPRSKRPSWACCRARACACSCAIT
jgi:cytosine/adenosine deaminase-related metal-dependent hydrolase